MHNQLANDLTNLASLLERAKNIGVEYLAQIDRRPPATRYNPQMNLEHVKKGLGAEKTLDLFLERFGDRMPASNGPRFWGLVTGGTTPASVVGDWLTSIYDLNLSHAANSIAPEI